MAKKQTHEDRPTIQAKKPRKIARASYALAAGRYKMGMYGTRIMLKVIDAAQDYLSPRPKGQGYKPTALQPDLFGGCWLYFHLSDIDDESETHHTRIKAEIQALQKTLVTVEPSADEWISFQLIGGTRIKNGEAEIFIGPLMWRAVCDLTRGFRAFEPGAARRLTLPASVRFYILMAQQREPIIFTIQELREMFGMKDKYKRPNDFVKRIIEPAKAELDATAPYSFDWEAIRKEGGRGNPNLREITAIRFTPIHQPRNADAAAEQQAVISQLRGWFLPDDIKGILQHDFGFSYPEYNHNRVIFDAGMKAGDLAEFLQDVKPRALRARNPKGYLIRSLRQHLQEKHNTTV